MQLVTILAYSVALVVLGPKPESAAAYSAIYQESPLEIVLRLGRGGQKVAAV